MDRPQNRVLGRRADWRYLANTVERLCAAAMSWRRGLFPDYFEQYLLLFFVLLTRGRLNCLPSAFQRSLNVLYHVNLVVDSIVGLSYLQSDSVSLARW